MPKKGSDSIQDGEQAKTTSANASEKAPSYLIELAKSGRAECKKCDMKIENKSLRVGVILEGEWGLFTRWQHLQCTIFHKSVESVEKIDGYKELDAKTREIVAERFTASQNEIDDEFVAINPDDLVRKSWEKQMEPHSDLLMPLLPYQKEGLAWMYNQELTSCHGGILADEMGMGKTIQAVSLILTNRPNKSNKEQLKSWNDSDISHEWKGNPNQRAGTLIVVPTIAIRQWHMEIARFTKEGSLKVKIYHGADRSITVDDILSYDVIITSYKILEIEYRKATAGTKVSCRICGKKFYPEKLRVHRKYFCGESAQRTEAQSKTERKAPRPMLSKTQSAQDNEDESDDEIAKQKKKNKLVIKVVESKSETPKKGKSISAKTAEQSSDDEVAKQKKAIKQAMSKAENTSSTSKKIVKSKASTKPNSKVGAKRRIESDISDSDISDSDITDDDRTPAKKKAKLAAAPAPRVVTTRARTAPSSAKKSPVVVLDDSEDELVPSDSSYSNNDSSEEEQEESSISDTESDSDRSLKKKKKNAKSPSKASKGKAITSATSSKTSVKTTTSTIKNSKNSKVKDIERPGKKKGLKDDISDSSDSDDEQPRKGRNNKQKKGTTAAKSQLLLKSKYNDDDDDDDDEDSGDDDGDDEDSEVERDIREALERHAREMRKSKAPQAILHLVSWFRVILDEAHLIKDRSTSTAKAVFNLTSLNKWCLTGTPLQNRVSELYSLIRFLRIDPHAYYFCKTKDCTCKSLHYRFTKSKCDDCHHSVINHYCHFNRHVLNPIQRSGFVADGRKAMIKLKHQILDEILLRRTKLTRADDIQLPMRVVKLRQDKLDEKEEDFYQSLYTQSQAQFNTYLQSGTVLNNYAHIFDILIRLRQAVNHPYLVIYSESQQPSSSSTAMESANDSSTLSSTVNDGELCGLCKEPLSVDNDAMRASCNHAFCQGCITDYINTLQANYNNGGRGNTNLKCPVCQEPLTLSFQSSSSGNSNSVWDASKKRKKSIIDRINLDLFQSSTKMEALMEELHKMEQRDYGAKAIVFSQFVNMLDLLEYCIQRGGIRCVKLLGSMGVDQRDKVVREFKEDPDVKVLLISLKAGGVALNLTVANYIYLMDPWWNPAAEMQAIDRTHRIGQHKTIHATRFIIENSIEERIIKLQEKKKLVFDGTVGQDSSSMTKLTVDDMRFLFQ